MALPHAPIMDSELKQHLESMEARLTRDTQTQLETMEARLEARLTRNTQTQLETVEARLTEAMRDMQTELLRGFAAFSEGQTIRLRKVEADQSNLDAALSGRVNVLERRLLEIELRLGLAGGK
jgi:exonuclease VII large subunit